MTPDTGTDTPRINIVVDSASPPVISIARLGDLADDTCLHQGADHDEQAREEQQRLPLHACQVIRPSIREISISTPAPSSATTDGSMCSTG